MGKTISFTVDDADYPGILEYARRKGHRTASNLARYAVYSTMLRNPPGRHDKIAVQNAPSTLRAINGGATYWQELRKLIIERDGPNCKNCGKDGDGFLHVHHVIAKSVGGSNELENLVLLCPKCHSKVPRPRRYPSETKGFSEEGGGQ